MYSKRNEGSSCQQGIAKSKMKSTHDKKVGEKVIVRRPEVHGKLDCAWAGPFEVSKKISPLLSTYNHTWKEEEQGHPFQLNEEVV